MGTILASYGDDAYDHEGYAAQLLDDGSLTGTYSNDTEARMVGQVVAACGCGWTGSTCYPTTGPVDETAHDLALTEWERDHARPTLDGLQVDHWDRLRTMVRQLAESHATTTRTRFSGLSSVEQRELLDRTRTVLHHAIQLVQQLRGPLETSPDDPTGGELR